MKKSNLADMVHGAFDFAAQNHALTNSMRLAIGTLFESLANTDPATCKEVLAQLNKQLSPESLDAAIAVKTAGKAQAIALLLEGTLSGSVLEYESEDSDPLEPQEKKDELAGHPV